MALDDAHELGAAPLERRPSGTYPEVATRAHSLARVRYPSPTRAEVEVEMQAPGFLVLADSCFEGWEAAVDGGPTAIFCANSLVRAVELGPGRHVVTFAYRSPAVGWGLIASAAGIAILCGIPLAASLLRRTQS